MRITSLLLCLSLSANTNATTLPEADVSAGKDKATLCFACHGNNGRAVMAEYPNLAGQNQAYLRLALAAYRDGNRQHAVMAPMAQGLSDQDIVNLAAFFASLPQANTAQSASATPDL